MPSVVSAGGGLLDFCDLTLLQNRNLIAAPDELDSSPQLGDWRRRRMRMLTAGKQPHTTPMLTSAVLRRDRRQK